MSIAVYHLKFYLRKIHNFFFRFYHKNLLLFLKVLKIKVVNGIRRTPILDESRKYGVLKIKAPTTEKYFSTLFIYF